MINDSSTNYLFFPEKIILCSFEKIQSEITKHKLWLQKNKHTQIWIKLCETLHEKWGDDPRNLIQTNESCVIKIRSELINNKKRYPYLNWPKMSDYRMFIMSHCTDTKLQNKHMLNIIHDTHIRQASIKLWLNSIIDWPEKVKKKWFLLLEKTWINPVDLHSMLQNRGKNHFKSSI